MLLGFGAIGFIDDYLMQVKKHEQRAERARQKLVLQRGRSALLGGHSWSASRRTSRPR
ncbi:MAG: hypothetical protein MZV70_20180 [Desulfobacterales bacterium]|nr:hypothetical protein [Desulfobacterales bacterium]